MHWRPLRCVGGGGAGARRGAVAMCAPLVALRGRGGVRGDGVHGRARGRVMAPSRCTGASEDGRRRAQGQGAWAGARRGAVALRGRGHADGREDGAWVVGGDRGAWAEARAGGREHGIAVTVRARVASPWRARLALGCGTCTQDLQQEKRKKTTYQVVSL